MDGNPIYLVLSNDLSVDPSVVNRWEEIMVLAAISDGAYGAIQNEWLPWLYAIWQECESENDSPIPTKSLFRDQIRRALLTAGHRARYPEDYLQNVAYESANYAVSLIGYIQQSLQKCGFNPEFMPQTLTRGTVNVFTINLYFYPA